MESKAMKDNKTITFELAKDVNNKYQLYITFHGIPQEKDIARVGCIVNRKVCNTKQKKAPFQYMYHAHNKDITSIVNAKVRHNISLDIVYQEFSHEFDAIDGIQSGVTAVLSLLPPSNEWNDKMVATICLYDAYKVAFSGYAPQSATLPKLTDTTNDFDLSQIVGTMEWNTVEALKERYNKKLTKAQHTIFTLHLMQYNQPTIAYKLNISQQAVSKTIKAVQKKFTK